ncbi:hypothetical protein P9112_001703 [Eukaryota sp. TZLM1-RC]
MQRSYFEPSPRPEHFKGPDAELVLEKLEAKIDHLDLQMDAELKAQRGLEPGSTQAERSSNKLNTLRGDIQALKEERSKLLQLMEQEKEHPEEYEEEDMELDEAEEPRKTYRGFRERRGSITELGHFTEEVEHTREMDQELRRASLMIASVPKSSISTREWEGEVTRHRRERETPSIVIGKSVETGRGIGRS